MPENVRVCAPAKASAVPSLVTSAKFCRLVVHPNVVTEDDHPIAINEVSEPTRPDARNFIDSRILEDFQTTIAIATRALQKIEALNADQQNTMSLAHVVKKLNASVCSALRLSLDVKEGLAKDRDLDWDFSQYADEIKDLLRTLWAAPLVDLLADVDSLFSLCSPLIDSQNKEELYAAVERAQRVINDVQKLEKSPEYVNIELAFLQIAFDEVHVEMANVRLLASSFCGLIKKAAELRRQLKKFDVERPSLNAVLTVTESLVDTSFDVVSFSETLTACMVLLEREIADAEMHLTYDCDGKLDSDSADQSDAKFDEDEEPELDWGEANLGGANRLFYAFVPEYRL